MEKSRKFYGNLSSFVGMACNLLLFGSKLAVGLMFGAMSVVADAFNNLSDMGSNVVSLVGFKVASRPADREHPFGHARAEYIAALIVAFIIFILAVELLIGAVEKIITPTVTEFSIFTVIALGMSILVKLFMFIFNKQLGRKAGSLVIEATAIDSISDVIATSAVLVALIISYYTSVDLDAYMTIAVAVFIGIAGIKIIKETFTKLLGEGPTDELKKHIYERVMSYKGVLGIHDLEVHNYGPEQIFASAHVEVDANRPILESHDMIDLIEKDLSDLHLVIHLDPIVVDDPIVNETREDAIKIIKGINPEFEIHDFRMVIGTTHTNVIFDLVVPFEDKQNEKELIKQIDDEFKKVDQKLYTVIKIDRG